MKNFACFLTCLTHQTHQVGLVMPHKYDPPKVQEDKQFEEFLKGEICCQNLINQDLTFLQPSVIHASQPKEDGILPEKKTIAVPPIMTQENNLPQEQVQTLYKFHQQKHFMTEAKLTTQWLPSRQWNL